MNLSEKKLQLSETAKYHHGQIGEADKGQACIFPVKVYDSKGVLKQTISVKTLKTRSTSKMDRFNAA